MKRLAEFILKYPRWIIFGIIGLTFLAVFPASEIKTDFDLENFYPENDETVQAYRIMEEEFGRDDNIIMVGYEDDDLFTESKLLELRGIISEVEAIPHVAEVRSIWSAEKMVNNQGSLQFEKLLIADSLKTDLSATLRQVSDDPFSSGFFLSEDGTTTAFYLEISEENNSYEIRDQIIADLHNILESYPANDYKITGIPYFRNQYVSMLNNEVVFYISISSVLIIMLLWYLYRSYTGVLIPMLIVWLTVLFTVATMTLTGGYLEIMSSTIAPILLCVGVADSIHMISKFDDAGQSGFTKRKSIMEMLLTLGSATFLTSITTAIGFGTLVTSSVVPMKRFGLYTAAGVLIAYTVTIFLLPSILRSIKSKRIFKKNAGKLYPWLGVQLDRLSNFNKKHHKKISIYSLFICGTISLGMLNLQVNGRVFDDVSQDSELIKDSDFFSENLAPAFPLEFVINTGEESGITDPDFIQRTENLQEYLLSFPEIRRATSFTTLLKQLHQTMAPEKAAESPIPDNEALIAQYLLLLEFNENDILGRVTDFNYEKLRLATQTVDAGSMRINEIRDSVQTYLNANFSSEEVVITGSTILSADLVGKMVYSLASSIGLAFICISILMALLFRDIKMVMISLIPNIIPLVLTAGIMGILGIDIKPSTAVIFTIAFGIAVDDTIHYLARFRVELKRGLSMEEALLITTRKTGRAIIVTSMILLVGFGTLITSEFTSTTLMGLLVTSTIFFAVAADLLLLPSLFYWLHPHLKAEDIPSILPGSSGEPFPVKEQHL